ncbi:MAG TPA: thiamine biosynthesis protein ApbE [Porphyromonadaceae bacterium]|jgi:thiamine biosynthesis lipoprotein|nr:thiamine biosynthesis protein ApbE [Porphyromonadaceae bacterium]HBL33269.1 thiamine biosynthesis protein ApbE [Porphyromonadaceae bacterium]
MQRQSVLFIFFLLFLLPGLTSCKQKGENKKDYRYFHEQGEIFHTAYHIKYTYDRSLGEEIVDELHRFEVSLNPFMENSIISKVNRNEPVQLDSFFIRVFNKAEEVSGVSDGKFDITVSPLINAWGFGFDNPDNVTPETIDSLKEFVGYRKISIDAKGNIVKTDPRVQLNMSAIAKGYSCDVIARLLQRHGIENYLVEIGGEIVAKGINEKGECWRIGIDKPTDDQTPASQELQTVLLLCDKSMATSGNYRNYYIKDGKKYAHTIDPYTGYPSENEMLSATVLADDCMTADAYATVFMVAGLNESVKLARTLPGLHYFFIYAKADGTTGVAYSDGFEEFFADKLDILIQ